MGAAAAAKMVGGVATGGHRWRFLWKSDEGLGCLRDASSGGCRQTCPSCSQRTNTTCPRPMGPRGACECARCPPLEVSGERGVGVGKVSPWPIPALSRPTTLPYLPYIAHPPFHQPSYTHTSLMVTRGSGRRLNGFGGGGAGIEGEAYVAVAGATRAWPTRTAQQQYAGVYRRPAGAAFCCPSRPPRAGGWQSRLEITRPVLVDAPPDSPVRPRRSLPRLSQCDGRSGQLANRREAGGCRLATGANGEVRRLPLGAYEGAE